MKKNIIRTLMLFVVSLMTLACSDDETPVQKLEVIPANLHGQWKLQELNGAELPEGSFIYIDFHYNGNFKLYQNHDSMETRYITGKYTIKKDAILGDIISGSYDFGNGLWNNEYIITDLLETGSMIWTVKDGEEVSKYVKVDEIPADILEAGKDKQEDK